MYYVTCLLQEPAKDPGRLGECIRTAAGAARGRDRAVERRALGERPTHGQHEKHATRATGQHRPPAPLHSCTSRRATLTTVESLGGGVANGHTQDTLCQYMTSFSTV